jgi:hypothetical protein
VQNGFQGFWVWLAANGVQVTIILTVGGFLGRYWLDRPRLAFFMDHGSTAEAAVLAVTNMGGREAEGVRVAWVQTSRMAMSLFPQPKLIVAKESLRIELSMSHDDRLTHNLAYAYGDAQSPFGYVWVTWQRPIRRVRLGRAIVPIGAYGGGRLSTSISLGKVPRTPFKESRLVRWWNRISGLDRRWDEAYTYSRKSGEKLPLANALKSIEAAGVFLPDVSDDEKSHLVLGELGIRGWEWEYQTIEAGYSVEAEKRYFPTVGASVLSERRTLYEAAVIALNMAIESDQDRFERLGEEPNVTDPVS